MEGVMDSKKIEVLNVKKLKNVNVSRQSIYNFIKRNCMEKVGPGIYISKDVLEDEAYVLSQRCPKGVISHDDALYYYGLVDREPFVHCITIHSGYNPSALTNSGYKVYTVKKELLDLGKTTITNQFGHEIPMYDLERTICDLVRSRRNFEIQRSTRKDNVSNPCKNKNALKGETVAPVSLKRIARTLVTNAAAPHVCVKLMP